MYSNMLVSFRHNLIFLKSKKTAGTSSEAFFQEALWGERPTHKQGWKVYEDGFCTPRVGLVDPSIAQRFNIVTAGKLPGKSFWKIRNLNKHSEPDQIRSSLGEKFWETSNKIVNVRNPFELLVSRYFYVRRSTRNKSDFEEWLRRDPLKPFPVPLRDDSFSLIRYENLQQDLTRAVMSLGLVIPDQLARYKSECRPEWAQDYRIFYTLGTRRFVEDLYAEWLQVLGYRF